MIKRALRLESIGSDIHSESFEISASVQIDGEVFQWVGQGEEPCRPFYDQEAADSFIGRMRDAAFKLNIPFEIDPDLEKHLKELRDEDRAHAEALAKSKGANKPSVNRTVGRRADSKRR